jgi:AcrR family transcriptional regulator
MIRQHQTAATREQILETAMDMLSQGPEEPFSHEAIARKADMGARTVYRYFPHRADLLQALWERLRETTQTRFPGSESEVALLIGEQFRHFDEHAALVRASLATSATAEVRERGAVEGRAAFRQSLANILKDLPVAEQRRVVAVCLAIYSASFWQLLRDRGELSGPEAQEAGMWAIQTVLNAAKSAAKHKQNREDTRKDERAKNPARRRQDH